MEGNEMRTRLFPLMLLAGLSLAVPLGAATPIFTLEISRSGLGLLGPVQIMIKGVQNVALDKDTNRYYPSSTSYIGYEFDSRGNTIARYVFHPAMLGNVTSYSSYRREGNTILRLDYDLDSGLNVAELAPTQFKHACEAARIEASRAISYAWRLDATGLVVALTDSYRPDLPESSWIQCSYDSRNRLVQLKNGFVSMNLTHSAASTTVETVRNDGNILSREVWTWEGADPVAIVRTSESDPNRRIEYQRDARGNTVEAVERGNTGLMYRIVQASYLYEGDPVASPPREISRGEFQSRVLDLSKKPPATLVNRVAVVLFYTNWAKPSAMMSKVLSEAAATKGMNADFYLIDADKEPDLASALGIVSVPTVIMYAPGKTPATRVGAFPLETLLKALSDLGALDGRP